MLSNPAIELHRDVRYGSRALLASPGYTIVALLSLSLGIAIATCAFSEMNGMALRNLPGAQNPRELVALQSTASYSLYRRFRDRNDLFSSTMAYAAPVPFAVSVDGNAQRTWGHLVNAEYFSTLGIRPARGEFFHTTRETTIVVSDRFWKERLGADPSVVGRTLRINDKPATIIGVVPRDFLGASPFLFPADVWMPVTTEGVAPELADNALERRDAKMFFVVGRLRPGVTMARAEQELDAVAREFEQERVDTRSNRNERRVLLVEGGKLFPLRKQDLPFFTSFLTVMAVLIMLIACFNVANMALARASHRRREIAIRLAIGAGRTRLIRQLLTESIVLAGAAGLLGYAASLWLMTLSAQVRMPFPMPVAFDFRPDGRVLLLTLALSLATGLMFGLAPALQATKPDLTQALKEGGNQLLGAHRRFSLRNILIVSQVAVSLTVLVVLGILSIGIQTTLGIQAGFNPRNLYTIGLDPVRDGYTGAHAAQFFDKLSDRVRMLPSVTSATLTETVPVSMPGSSVTVSPPASTQGMTIRAIKHVVGKNYFDTTGISIVFGRAFRREDEADAAASVIVSETMARELWGSGDPVGRSLEVRNASMDAPKIFPGSFDHRPTVAGGGVEIVQVIGVAANVSEGLVVGKPRPSMYFPLNPYIYSHPSIQGITLMVRSTPGVDALSAVRREISKMDDRIHPFNARGMNEQIDQFMAPLQVAAATYALIGVFGLVLASVGLAGVTAYSVAQRSREIGIRMALGAKNRDVLSLVMKDGLCLVTAGTAVGIVGAWAGSRLISAMNASVGTVSSTSVSDPAVLIGAPLLLALVAAIACYLPARKSVRVDPAVVLRQE